MIVQYKKLKQLDVKPTIKNDVDLIGLRDMRTKNFITTMNSLSNAIYNLQNNVSYVPLHANVIIALGYV